MKVEYGRSNYSGTTYMMLVQKDRRDVDYQCRMVIDNVLAPFVPMTMQMRDCDVVLCLDISSRQPLSRLYERRTMDVWQIRRLLEGIAEACEVAEQYLMDVDRILLAPEYIFVEPEQNRCRFAFGFEKETTFSEELSGLLCYLLDHISRDDYECVGLAYNLYQESRKETCGIRDLLAIAMKDKPDNVSPTPEAKYVSPETTKPIEVFDMDSRDVYRTAGEPVTEQGMGVRETAGKEHRIFGFLPPPREKHETTGTTRSKIGRKITEHIPPRILLHIRMFLYSVAGAILLIGIYLSTAKERSGREKMISAGGIALVCLAVGQVAAMYLHKKNGTNEVRARGSKEYTETGILNFEENYPSEGDFYPGEMENDRTSTRSAHPINAKWTEIPTDFKTERLFSRGSGRDKGCLRSRVPERTSDIIPDHFPYIIGKLEGATDHCPKSPLISRLHARLEQRSDGVYIIDLNSTNGTFINGNRLLPSQEVKLAPGDEIALADLHFLYETAPY
ncbi:MAG: FHA domain-containing protein [Lachnospiraceae bacterium]|nr:FHA domain-containing protein [Lachnospiraceae bacterium]